MESFFKPVTYSTIELILGGKETELSRFDVCFGGRRQFCKGRYVDLDSQVGGRVARQSTKQSNWDFDSLLKSTQAHQRKRIHVDRRRKSHYV